MQTVLWQYRESAKRNALFIFIWAHTADTIKQSNRKRQQNPGSQDLARFFLRFKPCQSGSFCLADAWRHCTLAFWLTAATTKSSVASDFFYRSFAPEEISEMFVNSSKWHQLWHWQLWSYEAEVSQLGSPLDSKAETNKIWRGIWASLDAFSRHSKFWTSIDKEW